MKDPEPWVSEILSDAGKEFYDGKDFGTYGQGCAIPFLAELEKMYPETRIFALGVLGPKSNAHVPNECINLDFTKRLTCTLSHIIANIAQHK
jgi:acetylornithine deacetylase/succinyl-diaminopimelate desuccinylase-like protein